MPAPFNLPLFDYLNFEATKNKNVLTFDDLGFFHNMDQVWEHAKKDGSWVVVHNRYFGPISDQNIEFLNEVATFYKHTDINTNLVFISSFNFPQLKNIKKIKFFYFPEYHAYYYPLYQNFNVDSKPLTKKFLSLNKRGIAHRQLLYQAFYHYKLLDSSYFSYLCETGHCGKLFDQTHHREVDREIEFNWLPKWQEIVNWNKPAEKFITVNDTDVLNQYQAWSDLDGWETDTLDPSWTHDHELYRTSFCSVVVESSPEYSFLNLSEKTIRALCYGHPIIFIAAPNTVNFLETLGFDLFRDIIDHSYDSDFDHIERFKKSLTSILKINQYTCEDLTKINQDIEQRRKNNIDVAKKLYQNILPQANSIQEELVNLLHSAR